MRAAGDRVQSEQASATALGVATIRAVHQLIDDPPLILEDPVSPLLLDAAERRGILEKPETYRSSAALGLRSHVVLRSRYAEDELHLAVAGGVRQFISLGAGYDTFAFRQQPWARGIAIVEMDHPVTQAAKQALFEGRGLSDPSNLECLPVDLEKDALEECISRTSLKRQDPTWMSCLGVLAYLRRTTVLSIFKTAAALPPGSGMVIAFAPPISEEGRAAVRVPSASERAAALGEPWLTRFSADELRDTLRTNGFKDVSFLDPRESRSRYYAGRTDLPAPRAVRLCRARV
jgi:methyltransferase (TIGR00027 family)